MSRWPVVLTAPIWGRPWPSPRDRRGSTAASPDCAAGTATRGASTRSADARATRDEVAALGELDVEAAQVGLQTRVLDGDQVGGLVGLVDMGVPHARRRGERPAGLPVHPDRVDDVAALIKAGSQQRVATVGWRIEDQIQR